MNKKLLLALGITAVIIITLLIIVWFVYKKASGSLPAKSIPATNVSDFKAQDPVFGPDGETLYYYDLGKLDLYSYNLRTEASTRLSENMDQPLKITWSPDRSQCLIKIIYDKHQFETFGSPFANPSLKDETTTIWNYNLATKKYTLLPLKIDNPAPLDPQNPFWLADNRIVYHYLDTETNVSTLDIAKADGSGREKLADVPADLYSILGYDEAKNQVVYSALDIESGLEKILSLDLTSAKSTELVSGAFSILPLKNSQVAYTENGKSYLLNFTDAKKTKLPVTLIETREGISDNGQYLLSASFANKKTYLNIIDLNTGKLTEKIDPNIKDEDITDLLLDINNQRFIFNDSSHLYQVKLK